MESRSHKACELFVLLVQPVFLCSSFRTTAKLPVLKGGKGCVKTSRGGEEKCSGKQVFELRSHGTVFQPRRCSSRHEWSLDVHIIKHVCTHPHARITVPSHRMLLLSWLLVSTSTDTETTVTEIVWLLFAPRFGSRMQNRAEGAGEDISARFPAGLRS